MTAAVQKEMLERIRQMNVPGFSDAYLEQKAHEPDYADTPFDDRLKELVDAAWHRRIDNRTDRLVRKANLSMPQACFEEVDYTSERLFDVRTFKSLRDNGYLDKGFHVIITGAVGCGKTYLSNVLATNACRAGYKVRCFRTSELFEQLAEAKETDAGREFQQDVCRCHLLILDEFLLTPLAASDVRALFEVVTERSQNHRSMLFCSHYLTDGWYERLGADPLAESILDRILPAAYRLVITSVTSMRTKYDQLPPDSEQAPDGKITVSE